MSTEFSSLLKDYPILGARFKHCRSEKILEANPPNPFTWERIDEGLAILCELHDCRDTNRKVNLSNRYHVVIPYSGDTRHRPMINKRKKLNTALKHLNMCAELLSNAGKSLPNRIKCRMSSAELQ
ncbi:hypothetical protein Ciccas_013679 [Cichlidogyrus casuarinus]|uniref:Uncharacterized protein n=1 Tax=Cichlidogyrus casuarinus TaxID=1844966 RepID=A0ABD2PN12_9PLAT